MGGWSSPRVLGLDSTCYNSNGGVTCKTQAQYPGANGICTADRVSINLSVVSAYNSSEGASHQLQIVSIDISKNTYSARVLKHLATNNLIDLDYSFNSGLYTVKIQGVDPDLVKAIIYMETTHGYYDALVEPFDKNTSILPMNIRSGYWKQLGYSRKELKNPALNIEAGIYLLKKNYRKSKPQLH